MLYLIQVALVVILAVVFCHWSVRRGVRPSVLLAIASAFAGSVAFWTVFALMADGPKALTHLFEQDNLSGFHWYPGLIGISCMITLLPASVVVFIYQRKMKR
jgi:hypothetical protein